MKLGLPFFAIVGAVLLAGLVLVLQGQNFINLYNKVISGRDDSGKLGQVTSQLIDGSRIEVAINGWNFDEANRILDDFAKMYQINRVVMRLEKLDGKSLKITFPSGLAADKFMFLINYLHYPNNFDLTHRDLAIAGTIILDGKCGPQGFQSGQRAVVYMPTADKEYDQAYVQIDRTWNFRVPFTSMAWISVVDARMPQSVSALERSIPAN